MPGQAQAVSFPADFSASDRLMWKIERDPVLRSAVLVVGLVDREPDWPAIHRTFVRAVERLPRLRQRVEVSGPMGRRIRWVDDPAFSLDYHLRRVRAPHPGDVRGVLSFAEPFVASTLDPARPLWEFTLIEGMEGGRASFVLKFHHTITDGVGGVDLAGSVFDTTRDGRAGEPKELRAAADVSVPPIRRAFDAARLGVEVLRQPMQTAKSVTRFATSLGRMLQPVSEPLSPELRGRGLDRRLDIIEVSMVQLRAAAHACGGTINDAFLAALGGGMHDYHERLGHEVPALRITMPISLRSENDPPGGNRFTPARFVLPIDDPDPAVRAQIAGNIAKRWRNEPAVGTTEVIASVLDVLPPGAVTSVFGSLLKNVDVDAANVPGLTAAAYLGGGRIDRMWAFAPPTGAALSITLLSHADTACIGIVSDLAAVREPELLVTCLEGAFEEVLVLAPASVPITEVAS